MACGLFHQAFVDEAIAGFDVGKNLLARLAVNHHHGGYSLAVDGIPCGQTESVGVACLNEVDEELEEYL